MPSVSFFNTTVNKVRRTFRTLQLVGSPAKYLSKVVSPPGSILSVSPSKMKFSSQLKMQSYKILVKPLMKSKNSPSAVLTSGYPGNYSTIAWTFGSITWYDNKGHRVKINVALNAF